MQEDRSNCNTSRVASASLSKFGNRCKCLSICFVIALIFLLVLSVLIWQLSGETSKKHIQSNPKACILIIGGQYSFLGNQSSGFEWYKKPNISVTLPEMLHSRIGHVAWHFANRIFISGGEHEKFDMLASTEILDLNTFTVSEGPALTRIRVNAAGAIFGDTLVICGGELIMSDDFAPRYSCEQLIENQWRVFSYLPEVSRSAQMVNLNGKLLILGGLPGNWVDPVKAVYEYSSEQQIWIPKSDMLIPRAYFGAAVLEGNVFVCGSYRRFEMYERSCEKYVGGLNKWVLISGLHYRRDYFAMIAVDGHLLVLGGNNREFTEHGEYKFSTLDYVEKYYPASDSWALVDSLKSNMSGHAVVVL